MRLMGGHIAELLKQKQGCGNSVPVDQDRRPDQLVMQQPYMTAAFASLLCQFVRFITL